MQTSERDRFWIMFLENQAELTRYVKRLMPDLQDTVDVVQEVGVRLLAQADAPADGERFDAWCRSVARHIVFHEIRATQRRRKLDTMPSRIDAWEPQLQAVIRVGMRRELEGVDPESREVLLRRYVLEQTSSEIAEQMRLSAPAVRMRLMRLRGTLSRKQR